MSKAKIASKNNPEGRGQAREYLINGRKIKPVKVITGNRSFFGAEFDGTGELVVDKSGVPVAWDNAKLQV